MKKLHQKENDNFKIISLFSGCGGLDLGFSQAGFKIIWANDCDKDIWETYEKNHSETYLDRRDIRIIPLKDIPNCIGIVGGPPCQSWSEAGTQKGIDDKRGQLFLEYIRILKDKQPLFFLAENVSGMLHKKHKKALDTILNAFEQAGYFVSFKLLNSLYYNVPQDRKRVIFIGFRCDQKKGFDFDLLKSTINYPTLKTAIWDLRNSALPALNKNKTNGMDCLISNHEYIQGGFSSMYMSRNRVRSWDEPSFTIQAGGRHAPIHPQANKMINIGKDKWIFDPENIHLYRRLSIRECARIQTFSDAIFFYYQNLNSAYKMIGNAVPVNFSFVLAQSIKEQLLSNDNYLKDLKYNLPKQLSCNFN